MTREEAVAAFQAAGFNAELLQGVPFVPMAEMPTIERIKAALDLAGELGLSSECWAEGMLLKPPGPPRRQGARLQ